MREPKQSFQMGRFANYEFTQLSFKNVESFIDGAPNYQLLANIFSGKKQIEHVSPDGQHYRQANSIFQLAIEGKDE